MHQEQSAGCIVFFIRDGQKQFLLLQHSHGGHWDFPKGKIEKGETKHQAALRELKEEADITAILFKNFEEKIEYFYTHPHNNGTPVHKTVFFFLAQTQDAHATLSHEHTDYGWFSYHDALQQLTYPNARMLLTKVYTFLERVHTNSK